LIRFHPELSKARVRSFNFSSAAFELTARARKLTGWEKIIARNRWFESKAVAVLESDIRDHMSAPIVFSYSYAALEIFRFAKARGWKTVLGQIDPGPMEEEIVADEHQQRADFESDWKRAPAAYWDNWRAECKMADVILVNSEWSRCALCDRGVAEEKIQVVPLAYEFSSYEQALVSKRTYPTRFASERPLRVLFLGQINLRKGVARLLEAAYSLRDLPIEFWMVGPMQCQPPQRLCSLSKVQWYVKIAHADAARYYRAADVFILPTLSDGFALTQLEAQAHCLPIIASRNCGEVVQDGITGIILGDPSSQSIERAIQFCFDNPSQLGGFSQRSIKPDEFSISALARNLQAIQTVVSRLK
jgi:glycosyltransferase involved in cell wall biosynthesis